MTAHTPGPWIAIHSIPEEGFECFWIRAQPGGGICRGFSQEIGTINGPQSGEQEANARLIATAPELLEELESAFRLLDAIAALDFPDAMIRIERVIAKAKGEQP